MSGECDKCSEHCLDCKCPSHWSETEEGKQQLLDILNETFWFHPDGTAIRKDESCDVCKNELTACVCMGNELMKFAKDGSDGPLKISALNSKDEDD